MLNRFFIRILSFVIVLSMLSSMLVVGVTVLAGDEIWDGTPAQQFAEGKGTVSAPYLISSPSELLFAVTSTGLDSNGNRIYYKLKNNIYVNPVLSTDWTDNNPISWETVTLSDSAKESAFRGSFNGDGYVVFGIYNDGKYTAPEGTTADRSVASGLFPVVGDGAEIKNVGLDKSYISLTNNHSIDSLSYTGQVGLVGYAYNASSPVVIDNCYIGNDVTMKAVFAGLVGDVAASTGGSVVITNCYAIPSKVSTFNEPDKVYIYNNRFMLGAGRENCAAYKIDYCYTFGNLTFTGNGSSTTKSNYCTQWTSGGLGTGFLTESSMQGAAAFENMPGLNGQNAYILTDSYPKLKVFNKTTSNVWDGSLATPTALDDKGNLIIGTAEELAYVIKNGGGMSYVLSNDIYLNDISSIDWSTGMPVYGYTPKEWFTSAETTAFSGTIDGKGHMIYGLYYSKDTPAAAGGSNYSNDAVALIPRLINTSTVKNIGVDYAYINAKNCAAGIVGSASAASLRTIEKCFAGEHVYINSHVAGGIIGGGDAMLNISDCYSLASLNATHQSGGILGGFWSYTYSGVSTVQRMTNCYSTNRLYGNNGGVRTNCYGNVGENCKGQGAIINFPLGEPYCATVDSYPTLRIFKNLDESNWNGLGIKNFEGEGTVDNPYLVENAGQLAYVVYSSETAHFKMIKDIYINDISKENWQDNENLISWIWEEQYNKTSYEAASKTFKGTFDGNGYVVHGIWYSPDIKTATSALFLSANGATIKNLGVKNSYIRGGYTKEFVIEKGIATSSNAADYAQGSVAAILGYAAKTAPTTVSSCFADDSVHVTNYSNGNLCATSGVVGYVFGNSKGELTITDCFSSANLTSGNTGKLNGILGSCWTGYYTAKNNYSIGYKPFLTGNNVSSMSNNAYSGNFSTNGTSCIEYTVLSADKISGANALNNLTGFSEDIWYSVKNSDMPPLHRIYGTAIGDVDENGAGKSGGDIIALRKTLIKAENFKNTDYNRDGKINICDLVEMNISFRPVITFNANGGSFSGNKTSINIEQAIGTKISVELPKRTGLGCVGWSLTPDGDPLDHDIVTGEMDGIILYAVWREILVIDPAFTDNMVLQRDKDICVWGTGNGIGEITIGEQTKTVTSVDGKWEVYFDPMEVSPSPVTFKTCFAGIETEYKNVLIGDVFITSGQSNMEFTLKSSEQSGTVFANSKLRFRNRGTNTWNEFTDGNVQDVSAISVLFANELSKALNNNIPIGIISTAVGASRIDDWTHSDYCYCNEYEFDTLAHSDYSYYDQGHHSLYAKHIQPIEKMTIAGVLWYQGESNRGIGEAYRYLDMFETMVDCWRTRMDDVTLPFYTVQIMLYSGDNSYDRNGHAVDEYNIRIAQGEAARTMNGVTVCTMLSRDDTKKADGGWDIHPTDKLPIAKALANAALTTYYYPQGNYDKTPEYSGPLYDKVSVNGSIATISFNHTAEGLMLTTGNAVTELEVRTANGNWVAATGFISGNSIVVSANGVDRITGVRMGYRNSPDINLFNTIGGVYGYCASPFVWIAD